MSSDVATSPCQASGVFPIISFLNHSCQANASIEFSGQDGLHAEIVATGDVASGDELYISYIDDDEMDLQERTQVRVREGCKASAFPMLGEFEYRGVEPTKPHHIAVLEF